MRNLSNLVPKTFPMRSVAASRRGFTPPVCSALLLLASVAGALGADDPAARIAAARGADGQGVWKAAPVVVFAIPAISATPRLPDRLPTDGRVADALDLVLAFGKIGLREHDGHGGARFVGKHQLALQPAHIHFH